MEEGKINDGKNDSKTNICNQLTCSLPRILPSLSSCSLKASSVSAAKRLLMTKISNDYRQIVFVLDPDFIT